MDPLRSPTPQLYFNGLRYRQKPWFFDIAGQGIAVTLIDPVKNADSILFQYLESGLIRSLCRVLDSQRQPAALFFSICMQTPDEPYIWYDQGKKKGGSI